MSVLTPNISELEVETARIIQNFPPVVEEEERLDHKDTIRTTQFLSPNNQMGSAINHEMLVE